MNEIKEAGRVVRSLGGAFTVRLPSGEQHTCRAKGTLKRNDGRLLVGDEVYLRMSENEREGMVVSEILPRKNALIRPPLANVTYMVLALSGAYPAPALPTVDKLLAICAHEGITPILAVTKQDLSKEKGDELASLYGQAGYPVFCVSSPTGEGVAQLRDYLASALKEGGIAAFAGASGVGKSTLLTALFPSLALETGELSEKTERGKHTTRHVELFPFSGGYVADTPGFSLLDFERFDFFALEDLLSSFPDLQSYSLGCRYDDCTHTKEEGCAVLAAIADGRIAPSRHETYLSLYEVLKAKKNVYQSQTGKKKK